MRDSNAKAYLLVTLAALCGCDDATAPDRLAPAGEARTSVGVRAADGDQIEQRKAMLRRGIEVRRRALANPGSRYVGWDSEGREVSPVRVLRDMQAQLERLSTPQRVWARGSASRTGDATMMSGDLPVEGYSSGGVGYYGMCTLGDVGAYTLAPGADWITSTTYVDFYINSELQGGWSEFASWTNYAYYERDLFSWGYKEKCHPESVAGGDSHTMHEAGKGADYGWAITVAIF
jgi:hypothetical protein